jgi:hypothetical protein
MERITIDDPLRSRLVGCESSLEICDTGGHVLGYFVPAGQSEQALYAWARERFNDADIEQARAEAGGFSTAEVLARLREE